MDSMRTDDPAAHFFASLTKKPWCLSTSGGSTKAAGIEPAASLRVSERSRWRGADTALQRLNPYPPWTFKVPQLTTPDGRYVIVRSRLWRAANPTLAAATRSTFVHQLMQARREVKAALHAKDPERLRKARGAVDAAKVSLGERGPVWWADGTQDYNRHLVKNSPYAAWFNSLGLP